MLILINALEYFMRHGETREIAVANIREAKHAYIDVLLEDDLN